MVDVIFDELALLAPDVRSAVRVTVRLIAAMLAGAIVGFQRERSGKPAGMRTHILVCMGTAMFVIAGTEIDMAQDAMSRVIQGLATGIGFLGAGAIIKQESTREITGLTTAAGIWMTSAIGVAVGLGHLGSAALGVAFTWLVLAVLVKIEARAGASSGDA